MIDEEFLASSHCYTPDPFRIGCYIGEQLVVGWKVPKSYVQEEGARILLEVRFRNHDVQTYTIPMHRERGQCIYRLIGCDYFASEGILTYRADIVAADGRVLESWAHHIWVEFIAFPDEDV